MFLPLYPNRGVSFPSAFLAPVYPRANFPHVHAVYLFISSCPFFQSQGFPFPGSLPFLIFLFRLRFLIRDGESVMMVGVGLTCGYALDWAGARCWTPGVGGRRYVGVLRGNWTLGRGGHE